jgi:hypothetical protein
VIEDMDYQHPRGLDRKLLRTLSAIEWVRQNQNVLFIGPSGIGKSWLACALAQKACRDGFSVIHKRTTELFRELAVAHVDGSIGRVLLKFSRVDVLVLDDFVMAPLKDSECRDFLEICDDRYQRRSIILTSQVPIAHWHEHIGDPTIAVGPQCLSHRTQRRIDAEETHYETGGGPFLIRVSPVLSGRKWPQTPAPSPAPPSPLKSKSLTDVNILGHHQITSVASLRLYSHRGGTDHSHRRNPQLRGGRPRSHRYPCASWEKATTCAVTRF